VNKDAIQKETDKIQRQLMRNLNRKQKEDYRPTEEEILAGIPMLQEIMKDRMKQPQS
jgi:hypothetical protein